MHKHYVERKVNRNPLFQPNEEYCWLHVTGGQIIKAVELGTGLSSNALFERVQ